MMFVPASRYHQVSDCKRYTICRIVLERGVLYELWCGKERVTHDGPHQDQDHEARRRAVANPTAAAERHSQRTASAA